MDGHIRTNTQCDVNVKINISKEGIAKSIINMSHRCLGLFLSIFFCSSCLECFNIFHPGTCSHVHVYEKMR